MSKASTETVKVMVRVRPMSKNETAKGINLSLFTLLFKRLQIMCLSGEWLQLDIYLKAK